MSQQSVAVLGASGLVGVAVVERLLRRRDLVVQPFVRSAGNAWRLLPMPTQVKQLDVLNEGELQRSLATFDYVINCARGDEDTMLRGLENLLRIGLKSRWRRFVHISSVAVYGDPPPPESVDESAPARPSRGSYGWTKLQQDGLVQTAAGRGLSAVILCPPNIIGPHSYFLLQLLDSLRSGMFALLDDGESVCSTVDVGNLAYAVELALDRGASEGHRYFVTDAEAVTWKRLVDGLTPLAEPRPEPRTITRPDLLRMVEAATPIRASIGRSLKHLMSGEVRAALRRDPGLAILDRGLRRLAAVFGRSVESHLRRMVDEAPVSEALTPGRALGLRVTLQQLRGVQHASARAQRELGYQPPHSFDQSLAAFVAWYRESHGMNTSYWALLRHLY